MKIAVEVDLKFSGDEPHVADLDIDRIADRIADAIVAECAAENLDRVRVKRVAVEAREEVAS